MKYRSGDLKINLLCNEQKRSSFVWNWFGRLVKEDIDNEETICNDRVFCQICLTLESINPENVIDIDEFVKKSSYAFTNQSTQSHAKHLANQHKIFEKLTDDENKRRINCLLNDLPIVDIDQNQFEYKLAMALVNTYTPFNFVENEFVKQLFKSILPENLKLPKRKAVTTKSEKIYGSINQTIISTFERSKVEFGSIDMDICFNKVKNQNYLGINFHYITECLNTVFLGLTPLNGYQSSNDLCDIINETLIRFNLNDTKIMYTTDEGPNLISTVENLLEKPRNQCVLHLLHNLFLKDLKSVSVKFKSVYDKSHELYHIFKNKKHILDQSDLLNYFSDSDSEFLESEQESEQESKNNQEEVNLKKDVITRFISVSPMLNSIILRKSDIENGLIELKKTDSKPSDEQWVDFDNFNDLFKKVDGFCKLLSVDKKPTQHLVLLCRSELLSLIENFQSFTLEERKEFIEKFEDRFKVTELHILASLLHPNFFYLDAINEFLDKNKLSREEFLMNKIEKYGIRSKLDLNLEDNSNKENQKISNISDLLLKHSKFPSQDKEVSIDGLQVEISNYIKKEFKKNFEDIDLIVYWNSKKSKKEYPNLRELALIVLSSPAAQTTTERSFWKVKLSVPPIRNKLSDLHLTSQVFINENMKFVQNLSSFDPNLNLLFSEQDRKRKLEKLINLEVQSKHSKRVKRTENMKKQKDNIKSNEDFKKGFIDNELKIKEEPNYDNELKIKEEPDVKIKDELKIKKEPDVKINDEDETEQNKYNQLFKDKKKIGVQKSTPIGNDSLLKDSQMEEAALKIIHPYNSRFIIFNSILFESKDGILNFVGKFYKEGTEAIFVIVYLPKHWTLLIVDLKENRSVLFDSLNLNSKSISSSWRSKIDNIFQKSFHLIQLIKKVDPNCKINIDSHQYFTIRDQPLQFNSIDCGIYALIAIIFKIDKSKKELFNIPSISKRLYINKILDSDIKPEIYSSGKKISRSEACLLDKDVKILKNYYLNQIQLDLI